MLIIEVVLDASGSMNSIKTDTIGAFNSYVEQIAKDNPDAILSLTTFNSEATKTVVNLNKVTTVLSLDENTYKPTGFTPLYDAVGHVISRLENAQGTEKVLVILTDGLENRSKEFTKDAILKLLSEKQEKDNWLVIYLGANQNSFAEGGSIGTQSINTMDFDPKRIKSAMNFAGRATLAYAASGNRLQAAFTDNERTLSRQ